MTPIKIHVGRADACGKRWFGIGRIRICGRGCRLRRFQLRQYGIDRADSGHDLRTSPALRILQDPQARCGLRGPRQPPAQISAAGAGGPNHTTRAVQLACRAAVMPTLWRIHGGWRFLRIECAFRSTSGIQYLILNLQINVGRADAEFVGRRRDRRPPETQPK